LLIGREVKVELRRIYRFYAFSTFYDEKASRNGILALVDFPKLLSWENQSANNLLNAILRGKNAIMP
jgi:hypothetical protein